MTIENPYADASAFPQIEPLSGATSEEVLALLTEHGVRQLRLQFTDVSGNPKQVEVGARQFERALAGEILFDGSAVPGFARLEESDMQLRPDFATLRLLPWGDPANPTALMICDVYRSEGVPFEGDPRTALKRAEEALGELGFSSRVGIEAKFFLFRQTGDGRPSTVPHDSGGYLDPRPNDLGGAVRRDLIGLLTALGFEVEAAHHEIAPGQQEIVFRYDSALATADRMTVFKLLVRQVANRHGLHASFMPKPLQGVHGSGMHVHQSLLHEGTNAFFDAELESGISETLRFYVGGLLRHARGFCAITNPLVNSYKRLVPNFEAPVNVAWALQNRSALIRVPAARGDRTRVELRMPDPAANPYLALAVQLMAGLDGIRNEIDPGEPVQKEVGTLGLRERQRLRIERLPRSLVEALDLLEQDRVVRAALGEHIYGYYIRSKRAEWREYSNTVHPWEVQRYLEI
jgi:glutamine synthetase